MLADMMRKDFVFLLICGIGSVFADRPTITTQPTNGYAAKNSAYTLRCESENSADTTWYKDGQKIDDQFSNPASYRNKLASGNLFFLQFLETDVGVYYCNVSNSFGFVVSQNASLQIPVIDNEFAVEPEPSSVVMGRSVKLHCDPPQGTPTPQVQWEKNRTLVNTDTESRFKIESPGNLVIDNVMKSDEAFYVCMAKNEADEIRSRPAKLTVIEYPRITQSPIDLFVNEGGEARFVCQASGDPEPNITWVKVDDRLDGRRSTVRADNSLVITNINIFDEGSYSCTAQNSGGTVQARAHLTVYTAPVFLETPTSKTVSKGSNVSFRCGVTGNPPPVFWWSKIQGGLLQLYARQSKGRFRVVEDGTLYITDTQTSDDGEYKCTATNSAGSNSSTTSLRVRDEADSRPPPVITDRPQNTTVPLTEDVELECKASGNPSPTIRWSHGGRPVLADSRISINRGSLRITDIMVTDGGEYTCLAISESGDASASAFLTIIGVQENAIDTLLPPAPPRPTSRADEITETSAKLYWGANGDESQIMWYSVEVFTRSNKWGWVTKVPSTKQTWARIPDLQPGTSYLMLVRAHNSHGISEPSPVSNYITTLSSDDSDNVIDAWTSDEIELNLNQTRVNLQQVNVLSANALNITWKLPNQYRTYVEGFYVRVASRGYQSPAESIYGSSSNYHVITMLSPYTDYTVTVQPFYHKYSGRPSNLRRAQTEEAVPGPPQEVTVAEGQRYVTVSWLPPKMSQRNGVITGYVIVCQASDPRLTKQFPVNATVINVALDNLNRDTDYDIGVAAVTSKGQGPVSTMTTIKAKVVNVKEDTAWWQHALIGALGGLVWVILCILIICLCRRRRAMRKANKQSTLSVPLQSSAGPDNLILQYQLDGSQSQQMASTLHRMNHPHSGFMTAETGFGDIPGHNINDNNYDDPNMKTFYNKKSDSMSTGPYATTVLLRTPNDQSRSMLGADMAETSRGEDSVVHGSCDSSCTDNNGANGMGRSQEYGERGSPPSLPSFMLPDMLPPPPQYPPPYTTVSSDPALEGMPHQQPTTTMPRMGKACNTCNRGLSPNHSVQSPRAHFKIDSQGRPYNPTLPHVSSVPNYQYGVTPGDTYHPLSGASQAPSCNHPYHVCYPHSAGSDSHHYAEPHFECRDYSDHSVPAGAPGRSGEPITPFTHQMIPPPHLLHLYTPAAVNPHNTMPYDGNRKLVQGPPGAMHHHLPTNGDGAHHMQHRNHSMPMSDQELCLSCAEQTEYDEPWSHDMHWLPNHWHPHAGASQVPAQQQHYQQHPQIPAATEGGGVNAATGEDEGEEPGEETAMLSEQEEEGSSHRSNTAQSVHSQQSAQSHGHSASEDNSKSGPSKKRRQRSAHREMQANRPSSPYNGYSTDSSAVFVPRKPYQKSQRRKRPGNKGKPTKSLAVQVDEDERQQDKV